MPEENILEPYEFLDIGIVQRPYTLSKPYMKNYAIIIGEPWFEKIYNIFSYSSLLTLLNDQILPDFRAKITSSRVTNLKPLVFDQRFNLTANLNAHVSRVAYCSFPFRCILSHNDDPLLLRIQKLYDILLDMFKRVLPGNRHHMRYIYNTSTFSGLFELTKPECYKYAECYGIESHSEYYLDMIYQNIFKINKQNTTIMNLPSMRKLKTKRKCKRLAFMCDISGSCSTILLSNLFKESKRGIKYINKRITNIQNTSQLLTVDKPFKFSNDDGCQNLFIYSDSAKKFTVFPNNAYELELFFDRYYNFFSELVNVVFRPLQTKKEAEFCLDGGCLKINFVNKLPNETLKRQDNKTVARVPYFVTPKQFVFFPSSKKVEIGNVQQKASEFNSESLRTGEMSNDSITTIKNATNLGNFSNSNTNENQNSLNLLQTASVNLVSITIVVGLIIIAAIWVSFQSTGKTPQPNLS